MSIVRSETPTANYSIIRNELIADSSLSLQARMLMVYLLSKPDTWDVNPEQLATIADGSRIPFKRRAVYAALKELKDAGYVQMHVIRNAGGIEGYTYTVYDCPQTCDARPVKVKPEELHPEEPQQEAEPEVKKPRKKRERSEKCGFDEFGKLCEDAGQQRIPADDPVFEDMKAAGIPPEYLQLHWRWFVRWARELDSKGKERKYAGIKGWRQVFRKSVRECWSRLWWKDNKSGQWCLTQAGIMAQASQNNRRE